MKQPPIAVIGLGALFPGSPDEGGFWRNIVAGRDLITEVPPEYWLIDDFYDASPSAPDKTYSKRGGFLPPVDFDPLEFGIPPNALPVTDTVQLLSLVVAKRTLLEACRGNLAGLDREKVSVILGIAAAAQQAVTPAMSRLQRPVWVKALRESGIPELDVQAICNRIASHYVPWQEASFPGLLSNVAAGRVANRLDLHGTNIIIDAACASSLAAIRAAINELTLGQADMALAGGVDTTNDIFTYVCFSKTPALSSTDDCRPFSDKTDGTMLGEGLAMFALKRLADAERDGDRIYGVIRGIGSSSDGKSKSIYAPLPSGQERALRRAYESAGYGPETVELVEAHGTGTQAGDASEFESLSRVFEPARARPGQWCALGSIKSQIGHAKGAAGAAGLFKAIMALNEKILPPTIKVERPNPALKIESSPFYLNTAARPWIRGADHPRRAAISSFGFGGTNFHLTAEEYAPQGGGRPALHRRASPTELVTLSADGVRDLLERCKTAAATDNLERLARETQLAFDGSAAARLAIVAVDVDDLRKKLGQVATRLEANEGATTPPPGIYFSLAAPTTGKIAFLFPGQGSQYVGMGGDLAMAFDEARRVWDETAALRFDGLAAHELTFPPPAFDAAGRQLQEERLKATEWAQPSIGLASLAALQVLRRVGLAPDCATGHSFGELTALRAAGALKADDFLRLSRRRGELMRDAASVAPGGMLAVAAGLDRVKTLLSEGGAGLVIANHNGPEEIVVSGPLEQIASLARSCEKQSIAAARLPVATAFHSPLVAGAVPGLLRTLNDLEIRAPDFDVYGSDAAPYGRDPREIRAKLARQLAAPVRFVDTIEALYARGVRVFVEVGPGSVLTGLVGRILERREHWAVATDRKGRHGVTSLQHALGRLAAAGAPLRLPPLWDDAAAPETPRKNSENTIALRGINFGKIYPPPGGSASLPPPNPAKASATTLSDHELPSARAYQDIQRQAAETHAAVQRAMAESHAAFLKTAEASLSAIASLINGSPAPEVPWDIPRGPIPEPKKSPLPAFEPAAAPKPLPAPPAPITASPAMNARDLLFSVVAEKTGYETSILKMDMELESDLGIDSIKRVEILAGLRDRFPSLPQMNLADFAGLKTLGQIVDFMDRMDSPSPTAPSYFREILRAEATAAPGTPLPRLTAGKRLVVTDDGDGVAEALVAELARRGIAALRVEKVPEEADAVIFLGGLRAATSIEDAVQINREAFRAARAVAPRFETAPGLYVAVQDTGGDFGRSGKDAPRAWLGGLAALTRTARREWREVSVKAIDCARGGRSPQAVAQALAQELFEGGAEPEVGLGAGGERVTLQWAAAPAGVPGPERITPESVVVVSGGARGVTAAALLELARARRPRVAILGRTALSEEPESGRGMKEENDLRRVLQADAERSGKKISPKEVRVAARAILANREIRATLLALENAGSPARYFVADVQDAAAVQSALAETRRLWGPVTALVHGAGVLADKLISRQTEEQFDFVFDTKVAGLRTLLDLTQHDPLDWICLFSSFSAHMGNSGQVAYAMANEVLNHVAAAEKTRRGGKCLLRSVGWGPWEGGMVTPELRRHFQSRGVPLLALDQGAKAFVAEAAGDPDEVVVSIGAGPAREIFGKAAA